MDRRRALRFVLRLPCIVTRVRDAQQAIYGFTANISSRGTLLSCCTRIDPGAQIEYLLTLDGRRLQVGLRCLGNVVRVQPLSGGGVDEEPRYLIAATIERYEFLNEQSVDSPARTFGEEMMKEQADHHATLKTGR